MEINRKIPNTEENINIMLTIIKLQGKESWKKTMIL